MIAEDVEFQISQYADGTLPTADRSAIEELMKSDPAARQMLTDYQKLDEILVGVQDLPAVRWDRFSAHISNAIDESDQPAVAGRIGFGAWTGRLRIAAAVLIVATLGIVLHHGKPLPVSHPSDPTPPPAVAQSFRPSSVEVHGPQVEPAAGQPQEEISVGPSRLAAGENGARYAQSNHVTGPSKVVISQAPDSRLKPKSQPH